MGEDAGVHPIGRRGLLLGGAAVGATLAAPSKATARRGDPRIVVVGAGLAGLTAAHRLHEAGLSVVVHEAADRLGGRAYTVRDLPGGLHAEAGGQFISSGDHAIRALARELGVPLVDLDPIWPAGDPRFRFGGRARSRADVMAGENAAWRAADRDFTGLAWPVRSGDAHPDAVRLDRMSAAEWLDRHVAPRAPLYAEYVKAYLETDYTAPAEEASALMVLADLAGPGRSYDERYVVSGGTDVLATELAARLPEGSLRLGSALLAVERRPSGYRLTFGDGVVDADVLVLALPFSTLAEVDLTRSGFSPLKRRAIRELGMGVSMKVNLVFDTPGWESTGNGEAYSDLAPSVTWPGTPGQDATASLMVAMTASSAMPDAAGSPVHGLASTPLAERFLRDLDRIFPGSRSSYGGVTRVDRWVDDPWTRGTYSYYRVGTMTEIAGVEGRPERSAFFAGEHTARYQNRATMNGAVWSGERAARMVGAYLG